MIPLEICSPPSVHRRPRQQQNTEQKRRQRHARWERGGGRGSAGAWFVTNFQATWQIANRVPVPGPWLPRLCQPQQGPSEQCGAAEPSELHLLIGPRLSLVDSRQQPCSAAESFTANFREAEPRHQPFPPSHDILHSSITKRLSRRKISPSHIQATRKYGGRAKKAARYVPPFFTPRPAPPMTRPS